MCLSMCWNLNAYKHLERALKMFPLSHRAISLLASCHWVIPSGTGVQPSFGGWASRDIIRNSLHPLGLDARGQSLADLTHNSKHSLWFGCPASSPGWCKQGCKQGEGKQCQVHWSPRLTACLLTVSHSLLQTLVAGISSKFSFKVHLHKPVTGYHS